MIKKYRPIRLLKSKNNQYYVIINGKRINVKNLTREQLEKFGKTKIFLKRKRKEIYSLADLNKSFKKKNNAIKLTRREKKKKLVKQLTEQIKAQEKQIEELKGKEAAERVVEIQKETLKVLKDIKEKNYAIVGEDKTDLIKMLKDQDLHHSTLEIQKEDGTKQIGHIFLPEKEDYKKILKNIEKKLGKKLLHYRPKNPGDRLDLGDSVIVERSESEPSLPSNSNSSRSTPSPKEEEIIEYIRQSEERPASEEQKDNDAFIEDENAGGNDDPELGEGLYGYEIVDRCSDCPGFQGVFSGMELDNLELEFPITSLCYLLETPDGPHWIAIFIDMLTKEINWYNSFGIPAPAQFKKFFHRLWEKYELPFEMVWKDNYIKMQADKSNNCGLFACDFIEKRTWGHDFKTATNFKDIGENEQRMARARINFSMI